MKIFKYLILFVMFMGGVQLKAQNNDKLPPPAPQTQTFFLRVFEKTIEALRVKVIGSTSASSTNFYVKEGNTIAAIDSVVFGFTSVHIGINNDESGVKVDSTTMYISTSSLFTASTTYVLYANERLSLNFGTTKLYFKFGNTAKANKAYRFIVN